MATLSDVGINQRFSFQVYPTAVLGNGFRDVVLQGFVNAQMALAYGVDIVALHANVYPTLPLGVPNDPHAYSYVMIRHALTGQLDFLGVPWIREETITISSGGRATLSFNNLTQSDLELIRQAVTSNGFSPSEVTFNTE